MVHWLWLLKISLSNFMNLKVIIEQQSKEHFIQYLN